jgi:hypothetical protein
MNCKKLLSVVLTATMSLLLSQCSNPSSVSTPDDKEARSFANLSSEVLIDLPSSIAEEPSSGTLLKKTDATNPPKDVYEPIRLYIGFADFLINNDKIGVKALIGFWRDTLDWNYIRQVGTATGAKGVYTWTASYDSTIELAYKLVVTRNDITGNPVVLKIDFNGRFVFAKGRVYYNVGLFENSDNDSLKIAVVFERNAKSKFVDVEITGCDRKNIDDPTNIKLSLMEKDNLIQVCGSSYHPEMDSIIAGVKGHCYTFMGIADPIADKSIVNLGLPPAGYNKNDNALFSTYGIAEMWTSSIIQKEIPKMSDMHKSIIVTSYTKDMTVEQILTSLSTSPGSFQLLPADSINSITPAQLQEFLKINESISAPLIRAQFNAILWLSEITQPVYFNRIGYAGNGSTVPAGFTYLSSIAVDLKAVVPSSMVTLAINP